MAAAVQHAMPWPSTAYAANSRHFPCLGVANGHLNAIRLPFRQGQGRGRDVLESSVQTLANPSQLSTRRRFCPYSLRQSKYIH
jgi:hypothetical protein